jgi:hypothetical protein
MIMKYLNQTLFQPRISIGSRTFGCTKRNRTNYNYKINRTNYNYISNRTNYNYKSNRTNYNYISNRSILLCTKIESIPFGDLFFRLPPLLGEEFLCIDTACIKLIFGEPIPNIIVAPSIQMCRYPEDRVPPRTSFKSRQRLPPPS